MQASRIDLETKLVKIVSASTLAKGIMLSFKLEKLFQPMVQ